MAIAVSALEGSVLERIESFFNDAGYKELTMNTARYNARMRKERVFRQPYIDSQTGVAQRNCHLYLSAKERMSSALQGQIYTYPARRWKSSHHSYLSTFMNPPKIDPDEHTITTVENPALLPSAAGEDANGESWTYYDENTYEEMEEDDFESEEDFDDETYNRKGTKRKKGFGIVKKIPKMPRIKIRKTPVKVSSKLPKVLKKVEDDPEYKPYICELCGMRYKTRPGLTYHYAHTHKDDEMRDKIVIPPPSQLRFMEVSHLHTQPLPTLNQPPPPSMPVPHMPQPHLLQPPSIYPPLAPSPPVLLPIIPKPRTPSPRPTTPEPPIVKVPSPLTEPSPPQSVEPVEPVKPSKPLKALPPPRKPVDPSPYCDFCLGDSKENRKTKTPEKLVSCSDCGRSGHPTCLQFTDNMIKSVLHYRWQCIECKTCSLCGTSENDDQLLFCDDCDRGYHLYCLTPPLNEPPEGEWSCGLCLKEFYGEK